jgi:hypothetical protein
MPDDEPKNAGDSVLNAYDVLMREHVTPVLRRLGFTGIAAEVHDAPGRR